MDNQEISRIQEYLRSRLNSSISVKKLARTDNSVEILLGDEFIAVCYRDEEEGEVSYNINMTILAEDLL